jgi:hypothetical protein
MATLAKQEAAASHEPAQADSPRQSSDGQNARLGVADAATRDDGHAALSTLAADAAKNLSGHTKRHSDFTRQPNPITTLQVLFLNSFRSTANLSPPYWRNFNFLKNVQLFFEHHDAQKLKG